MKTPIPPSRSAPGTALSVALATALFVAAPAVLLPQPARAQDAAARTMQGSPSRLVLDNSTRILRTLEERRAEFTADRGKLRAFVTDEFNSMFDRDYAARQVLGRHGRGASDADVQAFADALADNLMARYGSSLLDFNGGLKVRVKSETALARGLGVRVSSELIRSGGAPIPIDYLLRRTGSSWKVFDVIVEGVSFVQTFQKQFDAELQRKSIRQVAAELRSGRLEADARTD